ncbi:MAG: hypothetical protein ACI3ZB_11740 [Prevotella sp.]
MKYKVKMIGKYIHLSLASFVIGAAVISCSDKFDDLEGKTPEWLGDNIYDYLQQRGDCNYYLRLIDDDGLKETMKLTGSNTIFFANDDAFERYFSTNSQGIRTYEQLPEAMKKMFLRFGVIENAQLIDRLSLSDNGNILLRRTTNMEVEDTVPVVRADELPDNQYFGKLRSKGNDVLLLQDGTRWTMVQFFPYVMKEKGMTTADLQFITNSNATTDSAYIYSNKLIKQDIVCKNGYLHELQDVLLPPENMAGYIRKNSDMRVFNKLMDRFCLPVYYGRNAEGDSIYEMRYFNTGQRSLITDPVSNSAAPGTLVFDPGWNMYAATGASSGNSSPYEQTMACMFVPTDEAMQQFLSPQGEGSDFYEAFGSWDNVPTYIVADIINSHMKTNFLQALPSKFGTMEDEKGYSVDIRTEDIKGSYIARNGLVYTTNKVLSPQDYKTVMGPAKINEDNSIFNKAISETQYSYYAYLLRAPMNTYYLFVTPNKYMKGYVDPVSQGYTNPELHAKLDFYLNSANNIVATPISISSGDTIVNSQFPLGPTGIVSSGMKKRMNEILGTHTLVADYPGQIEELVAGGQEWFITNGYAPIRIKSLAAGGKVGGTATGNEQKILRSFEKSNGRTFEIDGLIQSSTNSVYSIMRQNGQFSEFFNICEAIGIFSSTGPDANNSAALDMRVSFFNQYHYTVYVPTNEAIRAAQAAGRIPTISEWENEGDAEKKAEMEERLLRFARYHFQDNAVFIHGKKEKGATYLSGTLNNVSNKFYPITVDNDGNAISLNGGKANVVTSGGLYNIMAHDIVVNNLKRDAATEVSTYAYAVVHQIDNILDFEQIGK